MSLGTAGKALRKAILDDLPDGWELDHREKALLDLAGRQADDLDRLERAIKKEGATSTGSMGQLVVNPAILEARQARLAISRLVGLIELPGLADQGSDSAASIRARKAAGSRWARQDRTQQRRAAARRG
jgi:hypothetical protein